MPTPVRDIALLTNPTAGKGRGARAAMAALTTLREAGAHVRAYVGRDADEALDLAREVVADGVDALVVCGGDGMVNLALQAVGGTSTPLGMIPAAPATTSPATSTCPARTRRRRRAGCWPAPPGPSTWPGARPLLRHRDGRRLRRRGQRAGQPDALAEGSDALQPRHPRRAAHLRAASLHPRPRRHDPPAVRDAGGRRQRAVVRRRPADHRGRPPRRRAARRRHHQADEQDRAGPHLPAALHGHPHHPPPVRAPPRTPGHGGRAGHRRVRRRRALRRRCR